MGTSRWIRQEQGCWKEDSELIHCGGLFEEYLEMDKQCSRVPCRVGGRGAGWVGRG